MWTGKDYYPQRYFCTTYITCGWVKKKGELVLLCGPGFSLSLSFDPAYLTDTLLKSSVNVYIWDNANYRWKSISLTHFLSPCSHCPSIRPVRRRRRRGSLGKRPNIIITTIKVTARIKTNWQYYSSFL